MSNKVELSNIVFKIGDKKIDLTLEEAKNLQDLLNNNFGVATAQPYIPYIPIMPYAPYYPPEPYRWQEWEGRYDTTGGTLYCSC